MINMNNILYHCFVHFTVFVNTDIKYSSSVFYRHASYIKVTYVLCAYTYVHTELGLLEIPVRNPGLHKTYFIYSTCGITYLLILRIMLLFLVQHLYYFLLNIHSIYLYMWIKVIINKLYVGIILRNKLLQL